MNIKLLLFGVLLIFTGLEVIEIDFLHNQQHVKPRMETAELSNWSEELAGAPFVLLVGERHPKFPRWSLLGNYLNLDSGTITITRLLCSRLAFC